MSAAQFIPEPRADDEEDVHWALSTATALSGRGESLEALKWLRRAAESASDANRDARSLELFKAAADFSAHLKTIGVAGSPSAPPPAATPSAPPPRGGSSMPPAPPPPLGAPAPQQAGSTMMSHRLPSGRSSPPPPPRNRQSRATSDPPTAVMPAVQIMTAAPGLAPQPLPEHVEPMAPTVPGPPRQDLRSTQLSPMQFPQNAPPQSARSVPSPNRMGPPSGRQSHPNLAPPNLGSVADNAAKTLASNFTPDQLAALKAATTPGQSANPLKKAATISDAQARELANRASRQMQDAVAAAARMTQVGMGPPPADFPPAKAEATTPQAPPVSARPQASAASRAPTVVQGARPQSPNAFAAQASKSESKEPTRPATTSDRPPNSRGRRRTTVNVRRPAAAQIAEPQVTTIPEARPTGRFEEEVTAEKNFQNLQSLAAGFDLEEHTNVISGDESFVDSAEDPFAQTLNGVAVVPLEKEVTGPMPAPPSTETYLQTRHAMPEAGPLTAFRVALGTDPSGTRVEAELLAPGEPAPAGRVGAVVVAVDAASSVALAQLFARAEAAAERGRK